MTILHKLNCLLITETFKTRGPKPTKSTVFTNEINIYEANNMNETPYSGRSHYMFNNANIVMLFPMCLYLSTFGLIIV